MSLLLGGCVLALLILGGLFARALITAKLSHAAELAALRDAHASGLRLDALAHEAAIASVLDAQTAAIEQHRAGLIDGLIAAARVEHAEHVAALESAGLATHDDEQARTAIAQRVERKLHHVGHPVPADLRSRV